MRTLAAVAATWLLFQPVLATLHLVLPGTGGLSWCAKPGLPPAGDNLDCCALHEAAAPPPLDGMKLAVPLAGRFAALKTSTRTAPLGTLAFLRPPSRASPLA